ncbi:MAG: hypothetical protein EOO39_00225 [Cytophagaceae bacterium]|nr:MAG: hypothetical protein EOO39_00225 [Cytophagaceae bacterium]
MNQSLQQVAEFHRTFDHPISEVPVIPDMKTVLFRLNFMREELDELEAAAKAGNIVEMADGLTDIQYVLNGFYLNCGLHKVKDALDTEVHRSNMSKACISQGHADRTIASIEQTEGIECYSEQVGDVFVVKRKFDGKVMKAVGYSKPELFPVIYSDTLTNG